MVTSKHFNRLCLTKNLRVSGSLPSVNESSIPKFFSGSKSFISLIIVKISVYDAFSYVLIRTLLEMSKTKIISPISICFQSATGNTQIVCLGPRILVALERPEISRQISSTEHKKASQV
jgi:hypothetical protein